VHGEEKFREAETEALQSISATKRAIVITGGGIILRPENILILKHLGLIVWLDGEEETLFARASQITDRPLLQVKKPEAAFSRMLRARKPLYAQIADIRVDTSQLTIEEVATAILTRLRSNRKPGSPIPATTS
jgi:shikimate kinase